jgi:large subunit ribosomal protein L15
VKRFRIGRGIGSGNGKTAGRGTKGQKSRSGSSLSPGFEGGQMPIQRRLPKRGFVNIFAVKRDIVNLADLDRLAGVEIIDVDLMARAGLVSGNRPVKVLANGTLSKPVLVKAHAFSAEAINKIQAGGGRVEVL